MAKSCNRRVFLKSLLAGGGLLGAGPMLSVLSAAAASAREVGQERSLTRTALFMGTVVSITVAGTDRRTGSEAMERAFAVGRGLEGVLTRFDGNARLAELNRQGRLGDVPPAMAAVLEKARHMHRVTSGAFDPTVLPLVRAAESGQPELVRRSLPLVGMEHVDFSGGGILLRRSGMALTLDGIAKGHIADAMSRELTAAGCPDHCIDAGGDIVVRGRRQDKQPWRIGVEDPHRHGRRLHVLSLAEGGAVATSGISRAGAPRASGRLVNPATGGEAAQARATVLAPDCATADALATALSVMPPAAALALADAQPGCACLLVRHDGLTLASRNWPRS